MDPTTVPDGRGGHTLRFVPTAVEAGATDETIVVLDTTWSPAGDTDPRVGLRDLAGRVLEQRDLFSEAFEHLDAWATASGVIDALTVEGTSFWYEARIGQWLWLVNEFLWLAVLDDLLVSVPGVTRLKADPDVDADLRIVIDRVAKRDGLTVAGVPVERPAEAVGLNPTPTSAALTRPTRRHSLWAWLSRRLRPSTAERRRRWAAARLASFERTDQGRLLVVEAHVRQRVDVGGVTRMINPYLGPVVERLRGGRLDPIELDIRAPLADDAAWARLQEPGAERALPEDVLGLTALPGVAKAARAHGMAVAERLATGSSPLVVHGVDLGPDLTTRLERRTRKTFWKAIVEVARARALLRRLRPTGVLLADEYHRQDWLTAAAAEGIPTAAIQHGVIHRGHPGYVHRERPTGLRLPNRTFVYGRWERDLLTTTSRYEPDEVVVGGSPRLDLVDDGGDDRDRIRADLGVADDHRLIVLSGTWGPLYRRFHYPIALAAVFDRPLDRVHVVVKLHPTERDEGPYRAVLASVAARGGFDPPPITVVQAIDLYRLLRAADAHLGVFSTVLTEAVVTGTANLLVDRFAEGDLLGYVPAGVAVPVRDGADLLAALDRLDGERSPLSTRDAFLADHFEPGDASGRIADDLLGWLAR